MTESSQEHLSDVTDGRNYKKLLNEHDEGRYIRKREAFTLLINTDGISLSTKSNITIWPIYLCINELPVNIRFSIENIVVAGI